MFDQKLVLHKILPKKWEAATFVSRAGNRIQSFGLPDDSGAHADSCACGVTGTCDDKNTRCNCDSGKPGYDTGYWFWQLEVILMPGTEPNL